MSFTSLYRISFYLMLFFATLTLSVDVPESQIAMLFPPAVAVAARSRVPDRRPEPAPGLAARTCRTGWRSVSIGLVVARVHARPRVMPCSSSLAHWLVYLQLIKMFLPQAVEDDWFLFLLGLMQVLVGDRRSARATTVGMALFVWAILALWVLALFSLHRDALRARTTRASPGRACRRPQDADPYPGSPQPALPALGGPRSPRTTLALGGVIFLAMPRRRAWRGVHTGPTSARST